MGVSAADAPVGGVPADRTLGTLPYQGCSQRIGNPLDLCAWGARDNLPDFRRAQADWTRDIPVPGWAGAPLVGLHPEWGLRAVIRRGHSG